MVVNGHNSIPPVAFASLIHPDLPVEVIELADLVSRMGQQYLAIPKRPTFPSFLLVHSGQGSHTIDFERIPLKRGRMVRTLPGQVQAWDPESHFDASIVLCSVAPPVSAAQSSWSTEVRDLDRDSLATATTLVELIRREQRLFAGDESSSRLLLTLFGALGEVFERRHQATTRSHPDAYVAYRNSIETHLRSDHTVRGHAQRLNYSERTINRACLRATGQNARAVLVERLVLEAKRLLAHTGKSAAKIAAELGFSEPTNFHKFFRRHTSQRPLEFREHHQG